MSIWHKICAFLLLIFLATALNVVRLHYRARTLTTQLSETQSKQHKLETDYRQLQVERAQWSAAARVEKIAREQMQMHFPDATRITHLTGVSQRSVP